MSNSALGISLLAASASNFDTDLHHHLEVSVGAGIDTGDTGRMRFKRRRSTKQDDEEDYAISRVMTLLAMTRDVLDFTVLTITCSGQSGCRGVCFEDKDHCKDNCSVGGCVPCIGIGGSRSRLTLGSNAKSPAKLFCTFEASMCRASILFC